EPETQAVMALAKQQRFAASISFHMGTIAVIYPRAGQNDPALKTLADSVAKALGRHPNGRPYHTRAPGPAVWGADQEWLYANGTYALLVELYGWPPPLESVERRRVLRSLRPAWRSLSRFAVNRSKDTQKSSTNSK
ncbi:MAG: M14 family metallopeptidase, partial [Myxococcota bacterium]